MMGVAAESCAAVVKPGTPLRVVFMGTPTFACATLEALLFAHEVVAVLTQPDRPAGRGNKLQPSPVKEAAQRAGIPVFQPETLFVKKNAPAPVIAPASTAAPSTVAPVSFTARAVRGHLRSLNADVFVVAAYGLLLPKAVLDMPRLACINVHASLLPKYRGASPIQSALLNGDAATGVSIQHMEETLDTGDIIVEKSIPIAPGEHFPSLHDRLAALGAAATLEALHALANNTATRTPQDDAQSGYAPIIKKTDGLIDWHQPTAQIINQIRALDPWPCAYTLLDGAPLKIWRATAATLTQAEAAARPGVVLSPADGLKIRTADGALRATVLQGANGKKMPASDFLRGRSIAVGVVLGSNN